LNRPFQESGKICKTRVGHAVDVVGHAVDVVGHAVDIVGHAVDVVGHAVDVCGGGNRSNLREP
jgi:hypothetical protein